MAANDDIDPRARRLAENEALFREVNENIKQVAENLVAEEEPYEFLCECGQRDCAERLMMTVGALEAVRQHPARFVIVAGHEIPDIEVVLATFDGYSIVEKKGDAAEVAAELDR